jgi:hypothetical protein
MNGFYKIFSNQLVTEVQNEILKSESFTEKHYFGLIDSFISILECLEKPNINTLISNFLNDLEIDEKNETNKFYKKLVFLTNMTANISLLKWKFKNEKLALNEYELIIYKLQDEIYKFYSQYKTHNDFIKVYCKFLYKIPKLALYRQALKLFSFSIDNHY